MRRILKEKARFREGDRTRTMTKLEAMHYAQVHKALKGDANAYKAIIEMIKDDPTMVEPLLTLPPGIDPTRIRVWPDRGPDDEGQQAH